MFLFCFLCQTSIRKDYVQLFTRSLAFKTPNGQPLPAEDPDEIIKLLKTGKYVRVGSEHEFQTYKKHLCSLTVVKEYLSNYDVFAMCSRFISQLARHTPKCLIECKFALWVIWSWKLLIFFFSLFVSRSHLFFFGFY